jgi:hypothetical protein
MWIYVLIAVVLAIAGLFLWGLARLRQGYRSALAATQAVRLDQIDGLRRECESVFKSAFGEDLKLDDLHGSARLLSARVDQVATLKDAFAKPDFYWYFVLPVGAFLGEWLRVHAHAEWKVSTEGGVEMSIPVREGEATTFPFDKVLKQASGGSPGDLYAYLIAATQIDKTMAQQTTTPV